MSLNLKQTRVVCSLITITCVVTAFYFNPNPIIVFGLILLFGISVVNFVTALVD